MEVHAALIICIGGIMQDYGFTIRYLGTIILENFLASSGNENSFKLDFVRKTELPWIYAAKKINFRIIFKTESQEIMDNISKVIIQLCAVGINVEKKDFIGPRDSFQELAFPLHSDNQHSLVYDSESQECLLQGLLLGSKNGSSIGAYERYRARISTYLNNYKKSYYPCSSQELSKAYSNTGDANLLKKDPATVCCCGFFEWLSRACSSKPKEGALLEK